MNEFIKSAAEGSASVIELLGLLIIISFTVSSLFLGAFKCFKGKSKGQVFREVRQVLGQGILLGLEFLVAADIIHTVALDLTFKSVGVLAVIVFIRTFLSFTLDLELTGKWPWQKKD